MEYRVLGPLEVRDGERSVPLAGAKQRALLALLLVNANRVVSRDRLIDELWGEQPPGRAVQSVQVYVSRLRKLLPAKTLLTQPPGYLLEVGSDELDLRRFERLLAEGREARATRSGLGSSCMTRSHSGVGRRWPSSRSSPSRRQRSDASKTCAWPRSRNGSRPISRSGATRS